MIKLLALSAFILDLMTILTAFVTSLVRKNKALRPIQIYILSTILFYFFLFVFPRTDYNREAWNSIRNLSVLLDVTIFYYYFRKIITLNSLRKRLLISYVLFFSVTLFFWLGPMHTFNKFWVSLYGLENLYITLACFLYFYQIFRTDDMRDFRTDPDFFVVCGLLFFFGTTFPFYISYNTLIKVTPELLNVFGMINEILSTILFATIIKAYLCPQAVEK